MEPPFADLEGEGVLREVGRLAAAYDEADSSLDALALLAGLAELRRMPNFSGSVSGVAGSLVGVAEETARGSYHCIVQAG